MKIHNLALNLLLLLGSAPSLIKGKVSKFDASTEPTFPFPPDTSGEGPGSRYIVKFKKEAPAFVERLKGASNARGEGKEKGQGLFEPFESSRPADNGLLTHGRFLPKQNAEVMYLDSPQQIKEWEERDDIDSIELDTKVYLQAEETPYGISTVKALDVPDTDVSNRKVCIIDTGYDITHPDLTSDTSIVSGYRGTDSAGVWDYDGHGHGTHVAGTIAAIGGNNEGVVGVNRNGQLKLYIVRVFNDSGNWAWGSDLIAAVQQCVDNGSNIVSMSLGSPSFSQIHADAYEQFFTNDDVLLVAAAGNGGDTSYSYPASYDYVMSVAATDSNNNLASFSQRNDQVDIAAPGVAVLSTLPSHVASSGYSAWSGTSMATPHVSGVAALVWSLDTTKSAAEIRGILEASAIDLGDAGRDNSYGHGLLQADRAKDLLDGFTLAPTESPTPAPPCDDNPEGWYDSDGPTFNCDWYAEGDRCAQWGDMFENFGTIANDACCVCGGGIIPVTNQPSASSVPSTTSSLSPTAVSSNSPSSGPSSIQSEVPSSIPSVDPTMTASVIPTFVSSTLSSLEPSGSQSEIPSTSPSVGPSNVSSATPTSVAETSVPSRSPSFGPSKVHSSLPSFAPSVGPSSIVSTPPTLEPETNAPSIVESSSMPSVVPSLLPSNVPSFVASSGPSSIQSEVPSSIPSVDPTITASAIPTSIPETGVPSTMPSFGPSKVRSDIPSSTPSVDPSSTTSVTPTTVLDTSVPSRSPSFGPSKVHSGSPSFTPSTDPSATASANPTIAPETGVPSRFPSFEPSHAHSESPSSPPSVSPSNIASVNPTLVPKNSSVPSTSPSLEYVCDDGESLLQITVVTDTNGSHENYFKVMANKKNKRKMKGRRGGRGRRRRNRFKRNVWKENKLQDSSTEIFQKCLPKNACYKFFMFDIGWDGMCCEFGYGGFVVTWDGAVVQDTLSDSSFSDGEKIESPMFGDECQYW